MSSQLNYWISQKHGFFQQVWSKMNNYRNMHMNGKIYFLNGKADTKLKKNMRPMTMIIIKLTFLCIGNGCALSIMALELPAMERTFDTISDYFASNSQVSSKVSAICIQNACFPFLSPESHPILSYRRTIDFQSIKNAINVSNARLWANLMRWQGELVLFSSRGTPKSRTIR